MPDTTSRVATSRGRAAHGGRAKAVIGLVVSGVVAAAPLVSAPAAAQAAAPAAAQAAAPAPGSPAAKAHNPVRDLIAQRTAGVRSGAASARAAGLPADGAFVLDAASGAVYRVVGRSLVYVSTWAPFGGPQRVTTLTETMWSQVREYPADGTFVTSIQERRVYRFVGGAPIVVTTWAAFGGRAQKTIGIDATAIAKAALCDYSDESTYRYCFVAPTPDGIASSLSGTTVTLDERPLLFVRGGQDGRVYRVVGGAPLYVSSWAPFGGPKPTITVDAVAIDRAGQSGPLSHLSAVPSDNSYVKDGATGQIFTIVGGAPVYVSHPAGLSFAVPSEKRTLRFIPAVVDGAAITRAGQAGPWSHLRYRPVDGVRLLARPEGNAYLVVEGAPESIDVGEATLIEQWWVGDIRLGVVGQATIDRAGQAGPWSHLAPPA